jgi:hypothetical protein
MINENLLILYWFIFNSGFQYNPKATIILNLIFTCWNCENPSISNPLKHV